MKLLLIGARGQLGFELDQAARNIGYGLAAVDLPEFDITKSSDIEAFMHREQPNVVINASAYTQVDRAESEPERAHAVNAEGPAQLAAACAQHKTPLIHISTDFVFDGQKNAPYTEADPPAPLGVYGHSKAMGEAHVRNAHTSHIILRTAWLYGVHGHNFVKTMLRLAAEKDALRVVADQHGSPTCAADLAEAILAIVKCCQYQQAIPWGTYHYAGAGVTSWHGFAVKILEAARRYQPLKATSVIPIATSEYPTPARRPANSALDCRLIENTFGVKARPWQESLERTLKELLGRGSAGLEVGIKD